MGRNNQANKVKVSVTVVDTTIPVITRKGGNKRVQCASKYTDQGAILVDTHDSAVCKPCVKGRGAKCTLSKTALKPRTACLDHHIIQHSAGYTRDIATIQHLENGARAAVCTDTCFYGKCTQARKVTTTWHTGSCNGAKTTFD